MSETTGGEQELFRRLPRSFRLKRRSLIRSLFDRSRDDVGTLARGCVRIVYRLVSREDLGAPIQVGFAPGRISHAVRRNRIKRLLREVYRVHQADLVGLFSIREDALTMMIVYRGDSEGAPPAGERIRSDLPPLLQEMRRRMGETSMSAERRE